MAYLLIKQQGCKLKQSWYVTPISNGANKWLIELGQCNEHMVSNLLIWVFQIQRAGSPSLVASSTLRLVSSLWSSMHIALLLVA